MKRALVLALFAGLVSTGFVPTDADAKRLGGGGSAGMQRSTPTRPAADALPAKPGAPTAAAATAGAAPAAAAAATKRSWMGPIAGLAAGLGLAALMSHLGLGAEFANILMMLLIGLAAFFVIRLLLRRFGPQRAAAPQGMQFAGAGAGAAGMTGGTTGSWNQPPLPQGGSTSAPAADAVTPVAADTPATPVAAAAALPADFDVAGFQRIAKMIFIRMQAANDAGNLDDLRNFTTPEMFSSLRVDLQDRGAATQRTDVVRIDAEVLDVVTEGQSHVVSVRFSGLIREEADGGAAPFDEVWHLVKPLDGSREWAIAGIQQTA